MRKRTSAVWLCSREEFVDKINSSKSLKDALSKFGLGLNGNNHQTIKLRAKIENVDLTEIIDSGKRKTKNHNKSLPLNEVLVVDITKHICSHHLKNRLIKTGLLKNECSNCKLIDWQNQKISLHLDHKNGNRQDNTIENLRLLCPNCHSQTDNYAGKSKNKNKVK